MIRKSQSTGATTGVVTTHGKPLAYSRLEPRNRGRSIKEGLQARVGDPLFLLGRQWQVGEFRAQNGGQIVRAELDLTTEPLDRIEAGRSVEPATVAESFDLKMPLEMKVEEEVETATGGAVAKNWDPSHLEYNFALVKGKTKLTAEEYDGGRLDWYSFDLAGRGPFEGPSEHLAVRPSRATFPGAPLPRWWSFEDRQIHLGDLQKPQLNFLAMLLVEFTLLYSNDWYVVPVSHPVGHIRSLDRLVVLDSFGVVSEARPVIDPSANQRGWEAFTLSGGAEPTDGRLFYLPNNLYHALESEPVEAVSLLRDEGANLVWAIEHKYEAGPGDVRNRHDEGAAEAPPAARADRYWDTEEGILVHRSDIDQEGEPGSRFVGPIAIYEPMTYLPPHWIPYLPRQVNTEEEFVLRRGRTREDLSAGTQYKGVLLSESKCVYEEEVPTTGIKLSRVYQLARDIDRRRLLWRGRKKAPDEPRLSSGLRFDALLSG